LVVYVIDQNVIFFRAASVCVQVWRQNCSAVGVGSRTLATNCARHQSTKSRRRLPAASTE